MSDFNRFGVMLDMSRNAVMKVDELKKFMIIIKKMGYNAVGLYLEDTYEIDGEPFFGYLRGRYSAAEIREIDQFAKQNGIELIPYIQTLAHLNNLTKHSVYNDIFDIEDVLLIDEPKTYELIDKMLDFCSKNFSSRTINIGMDEAFNVGRGKYLTKYGYKDRYEILIRHLNKVVELVNKHGLKANMWSDMFFRIACGGDYYVATDIPEEVRALVPKEIGLEYWDYYHKDKRVYDGMFKAHSKFDREVSYAGGAWCWHGFAPLARQSLNTMKPAMQSVKENGVKNVMITMWGDGGHECSFYSLLHVLYAIRKYADGVFDQTTINKEFNQLFSLNFDDFMLLDLPNVFASGAVEEPENPCRVLLYQDLFMGYLDQNKQNRGQIFYGEYKEKIEKAIKNAGDYGYIFDFYQKLCAVLEIKAELGTKIRSAYKAKDTAKLKGYLADILELIERVKAFHQSFSYLWHKENKAHGFEIHDARLGGLIMRLTTCHDRLNAYLLKKLDKIEELEETILAYDDGTTLRHHSYGDIISMNRY